MKPGTKKRLLKLKQETFQSAYMLVDRQIILQLYPRMKMPLVSFILLQ